MLPSKSLSKPFRPPFKVPSAAGTTNTANNAAPTGTKGVTNITNSTPKAKVETKVVAPEKLDENNNQKTDFVSTYFEIYYTKDIKKKNKSFNDGFVELSRNKIKMFDADGNDIYNTSRGRFFKETPKPDEEYSLGPYLLQIQKQIPSESFTSGRCFLKHQSNPAAHIKPVLQTSALLHKKMKVSKDTEAPVEIVIPNGAYPLVEGKPENSTVSCYIDPFLCTQMRIHQKEGVKFMFECITGLKAPEITGCILADSMGLGKTLQTIGLIWTLIKQNPHSAKKPFVNKAIVLAPLSVVKNWEKEVAKWLGSARLQPLVALGDKDDVGKTIENFKSGHYRCLLTSYEVFMKYATQLNGSCDLLILDEGHRLKNLNNKTFQCFSQFACKRRIILTGTPLQNRLEELYACCEFINPGIFPNLATFRKVFINPITAGLKKNANADDHSLAADRSKELSKILASFILRRSASILDSILPPKHEYFLLLKLTEAQKIAYKKILNQKVFSREASSEGLDAFSLIIVLRKLLNHPKLFLKDNSDSAQIGLSSFPENIFQMNLWESSIKFKFTKQLIDNMQHGDKMVIVSYFTQTLELIETMCNEINIKYLRLDGQVQGLKRQRLVDRFNDKTSGIKLFLLCAKAGGTGLNLTGANKMVLFEADWNPSNDHQIMGRIWRDGQKKEAKIYRLVSCGTIEEKIIQRQFVKENLSLNVVDEKNAKSLFDTQDLKKIFKFENDTKSIIFGENENEKDKAFEENDDLTLAMKNDIVFVKKKTDTSKAKAVEDQSVKNDFEADQFFLKEEEEEEEEKKESDESGESQEKKKGDSDDEECVYTFTDDEEEEKSKAKSKTMPEEKKPSKKETKNEKKKEDSEDEECVYTFTDDEEEEEKPKSEEKKVVSRNDKKEESSEEEEDEMEDEDDEDEDEVNDSKEEEEQELEKDMGSMTIEKESAQKTTPPNDENSTIEVEQPVKEEKTETRSGKESLKRKEPNNNNIGENVLKKLKLL